MILEAQRGLNDKFSVKHIGMCCGLTQKIGTDLCYLSLHDLGIHTIKFKVNV